MTLVKEVLDINWSEPFEVNPSEEKIASEYLTCLHKSFGHSSFRKTQWKVIDSIMNERRDNCVIMATGYGKSLCFQFPSVYLDTVTIVVSPLISLMQDQVLGMRLNKLRACFLGSAQENRETLTEIIDLKYNIVYATPEYITSETGEYLLGKIQEHLTLIAIDEAHCISKWGHEFRFAYRSLCRLRDLCPDVPILAMTATATPQVRDDIVQCLKLRDPQVISTGFDRPNLEFAVRQRAASAWADIGPLITGVKIGSVIVYCMTRRSAEEVAASIEIHGHPCGVYHAGLSLSRRKKTHEDFIHDRIRVICATIAFGMGINKPDVRLVIHYGVSKDLESYYQEVGRAGRDGLPSKCLMLHDKKDWALIEFIRAKSQVSKVQEEKQIKLLDVMRRYVHTDECRRRFILSYFGDDCSGLEARSNCCDNCRPRNAAANLFNRYVGLCEDGKLDITDESMKLLQFVADNNGMLGMQKIILVLRGSKSKSAPAHCLRHPLYGSLSAKPIRWLEAVADYLLNDGFLETQRKQIATWSRGYSTWTIAAKGREQLKTKAPIRINPTDEFIRHLKIKVPKLALANGTLTSASQTSAAAAADAAPAPPAKSEPQEPALHEIYRPLMRLRMKLASIFDVMPYLVASTKALQQLATSQPTTLEELRKLELDGYSEEKIERFGPAFLKVIRDFHAKSGKPVKKDATATTTLKHLLLSGSHSDQPSASSSKADEVKQERSDPNPSMSEVGGVEAPQDPAEGDQDGLASCSQGSVEIIEPESAPVIEILSDTDEEVDYDDDNWDSGLRDSDLFRAGEDVANQNSSSDCENEELDLLIAALKADRLCSAQANARIENEENIEPIRHVVKEEQKGNRSILQYFTYNKPAAIPSTSEPAKAGCASTSKPTNGFASDQDLFDEFWDSDIDEGDLTQISEEAEHVMQAASATSPESTPSKKPPTSVDRQVCPAHCLEPIVKLEEGDRELDLLLSEVELDFNRNASANKATEAPPKANTKARVIQKTTSAFEYEDDSSDSDGERSKRPSLPKKRVLPSWMQLSNKRKR